ncbi:MAG: DUF1732 domain-containing protein, partial [Pseudomonadota bacterium]
RLPDWLPGLEQAARALLTKSMARGSVTLSLRLQREMDAEVANLNQARLKGVLTAIREIETAATAAGVELGHPTALDVLNVKGVQDVADLSDRDIEGLRASLLAGLSGVLETFLRTRMEEGGALGTILGRQLDGIEALIGRAGVVAKARKETMAETLEANLRLALGAALNVDEGRVAQELALLAAKADITEELDRLSAHVSAARALIAADDPAGRRLDFLMQEFNREANTLCSKSGARELTVIGLDLKALADQMREQVQNVE